MAGRADDDAGQRPGLWANKNTFINRNDTSGEMLDSLDARDISLRLEDQGVHNLMFPHSLIETLPR